MNKKARKTIDVESKELIKIQILAIKNDLSVKQMIEKIVSDSLNTVKDLKLIANG